jgi:hypothetical protein
MYSNTMFYVLRMNANVIISTSYGPLQDNDFFARVGAKLNIIRMHEKGLTHVWHAKDCKLGSFVENDFFKSWYVLLFCKFPSVSRRSISQLMSVVLASAPKPTQRDLSWACTFDRFEVRIRNYLMPLWR